MRHALGGRVSHSGSIHAEVVFFQLGDWECFCLQVIDRSGTGP
jgi:hypothetical protein